MPSRAVSIQNWKGGWNMFVRVFDKANSRYYKSLVYGLVNRGYFEQAIVIDPYANCFRSVRYLEREDPLPGYEVIQEERTGWITAAPQVLNQINLHRIFQCFVNISMVMNDCRCTNTIQLLKIKILNISRR